MSDTEFEVENIDFNLDSIKLDLPNFTSEKLCEIVVCYRYLKIHKELSILSMEELSKRRLSGDNFDFESYIENSYKELPEIDLSIPNFGEMINQVSGLKL